MKYLIVSALCFLCSISKGFAQVDPALTGAVVAGDASKKKALDDIHKKQNSISALQSSIVANTTIIRDYEKKTYDYLSNVSSAVKNAVEVKEALLLTTEIVKAAGSCLDAAKKHPQGVAMVALINKNITKLTTDMVGVYSYITTLSLDKKTLLNAAERNQITWTVLYDLKKIRSNIYLLQFQIENFTLADLPRVMFPEQYFYIVDGERIARDITKDFKKFRH